MRRHLSRVLKTLDRTVRSNRKHGGSYFSVAVGRKTKTLSTREAGGTTLKRFLPRYYQGNIGCYLFLLFLHLSFILAATYLEDSQAVLYKSNSKMTFLSRTRSRSKRIFQTLSSLHKRIHNKDCFLKFTSINNHHPATLRPPKRPSCNNCRKSSNYNPWS